MAIQLKQCLLGLIATTYFGAIAAQLPPGCEQEIAKCFTNADLASLYKNITASHQQTSSWESAILDNVDSFCENKDQTAQVVVCMLENTPKCLPTFPSILLPNYDAMDKAINHMCANKKNISSTCLKNKINDFIQCGKEEADKLSSSVKGDVCKLYNIVPVCLKKTLRSCGCQTTKTFVDVAAILAPKSCSALDVNVTCSSENPNDFADGGASGVYSFWTWNILIAFLFAVTWSRIY